MSMGWFWFWYLVLVGYCGKSDLEGTGYDARYVRVLARRQKSRSERKRRVDVYAFLTDCLIVQEREEKKRRELLPETAQTKFPLLEKK